ncbi:MULTISPECIES: AraC family transcriptional regulator [Paenibacillus]|uniref:AraC family transcriptional regulator n=1 Tax=Paenibacillus TaxID=44249 RepID=UPI0022B8A7EC|nr:AraC family transcriptional regulator [Paenibacillus caseinilyticus]MCZ8522686.1 AraC family transcriptional regulator [Paenibacillus caseinilyticus]
MKHGSLYASALTEGEYRPQAVAYYYKQWNGFRMPYHRHDATEIMFIISGSCTVEAERSPGQYTCETLKKGDFILLDANVAHRLFVEEEAPCRMLNVEFYFHPEPGVAPSVGQLAAKEASMKALLLSPAPYLVLNDPDEVYHTLKSLVLELDAGVPDDEGVMAQLLFSQLLLRIARLRQSAEQSAGQPAEFYVLRCIGYMRQHYDQDLRVKQIAAIVNLHPGYLQRIFKGQTGRTLTEFLTEIRMEKAKMLLLQTDIPVIDISGYVGVGSRQYFHLLFKKYTGLTPVAFRQSGVRQKGSTVPSEDF